MTDATELAALIIGMIAAGVAWRLPEILRALGYG